MHHAPERFFPFAHYTLEELKNDRLYVYTNNCHLEGERVARSRLDMLSSCHACILKLGPSLPTTRRSAII